MCYHSVDLVEQVREAGNAESRLRKPRGSKPDMDMDAGCEAQGQESKDSERHAGFDPGSIVPEAPETGKEAERRRVMSTVNAFADIEKVLKHLEGMSPQQQFALLLNLVGLSTNTISNNMAVSVSKGIAPVAVVTSVVGIVTQGEHLGTVTHAMSVVDPMGAGTHRDIILHTADSMVKSMSEEGINNNSKVH